MLCVSCEPHPASTGQVVPSPTALSTQGPAEPTQELGCANVEDEDAAGAFLMNLIL